MRGSTDATVATVTVCTKLQEFGNDFGLGVFSLVGEVVVVVLFLCSLESSAESSSVCLACFPCSF